MKVRDTESAAGFESRIGWRNVSMGWPLEASLTAAAATAVIAIAGAVFGWQAYQDRQNCIACGASKFSRQTWCLLNDPLLGFVEIKAGP